MTEQTEWRPCSGLDVARLRAAMLDRLRSHFRASDVLEIDTPTLSKAAVSDPHIESIAATLSLDEKQDYFLHTSPEFCMKRLLCAGYPDIYQVCKVFRDNEAGRCHQPEFTMIEWYRLDFGLEQIIDDTLQLIATVLDKESLRSAAQSMSYHEAFQRFVGCDPGTDNSATLSGIIRADDTLKNALGDDRDAWLDLILDEMVRSQFPQDRLTVLYHYPISQAALARPCPSNAGLADRFEVFLGPLELANGYVELADVDELAERFALDQQLRGSRGQNRRPLDAAFLAAMQSGLPPCAGVAAGLDRLLMVSAGTTDIRNVQTFVISD